MRQWRPTVQKGFTLIELVLMISIIAIIATVVLPAFDDYEVRVRLKEFAAANNLEVDLSKPLQNRTALLNDGRRVDCISACKIIAAK
jgi:prepilin-type N-terminal cleavage/methylation domain-containing protein